MVSLYMVCGKEIRMGRLLKNGKMLCIPMDHGISNGPINGLENIHGMIYQCENAGLTCVLVNKGIIKTMPTPINIGIVLMKPLLTRTHESPRSEEHTSELQSQFHLVCRLLLEKK